MLLLCAGKTRTILNLLSVVMHSAAKGSLELVPSVAKQPSAALAAAGSSADGDENERQRQWRQASPWMFGEPTVRDMVGPTASTGEGAERPAGAETGAARCCCRKTTGGNWGVRGWVVRLKLVGLSGQLPVGSAKNTCFSVIRVACSGARRPVPTGCLVEAWLAVVQVQAASPSSAPIGWACRGFFKTRFDESS